MKKKRNALRIISENNRITEFERNVYWAVLRIPKGRVRSYSWVAAAIGKPRAVRAVGNALNKNPYIGIVPCHRVVRSDGSIGGFARGVVAKRRMLMREGVDCAAHGCYNHTTDMRDLRK